MRATSHILRAVLLVGATFLVGGLQVVNGDEPYRRHALFILLLLVAHEGQLIGEAIRRERERGRDATRRSRRDAWTNTRSRGRFRFVLTRGVVPGLVFLSAMTLADAWHRELSAEVFFVRSGILLLAGLASGLLGWRLGERAYSSADDHEP